MTGQVQIRFVTAQDEALVLEWANDAATRQNSFSQGRITPDEHKSWFKLVLESKDFLVMGLIRGEPFGFLRIKESGEISINLGAKYRSMGLGTELIREASAHYSKLTARRILARVKPNNVASLSAFTKAGYINIGQDEVSILMAYEKG